MEKTIFYVICLFLFLVQTNCTESQTTAYSPAVENRITRVENGLMSWIQTQDTLRWSLKQRMDFYKIQGLSIAVINDGRIEWAKGYGWADSQEHRPVTEQTLFQAASISKSLNAVGVLKLVQDKKIDLNTDINQYLKSWKFPYDSVSKNKKITVSQLLSHTAGLSVHGFPGYPSGQKLPAITDVLDGKTPANTAPVRSEFEPGLKFQYSGGGVTVSQLIVTDITGQAYTDYMWENVLKPLGMTQSSFLQPPPAGKQQLLSSAYRTDGSPVEGRYHIYPEQAAAGLWTNPTDLCKYIMDTQLSFGGNSGKVLSTEMTRLRLTPVDGSSALGVFIETRGAAKYFNHNGGNEGFACTYYGSTDEGKGVVVMLNSDNGAIMEEIVNAVASVYNWKDFYNPVFKKIIQVPDSILTSCTGKYMLNGEPVLITRENDKLFVNFRGMVWNLYFTSITDFFVVEYKADFKFLRDSAGKVTGFSFFGGNAMANKVD
jgi:CubicO group peptidase (beta-lactamase class C family)